MDFEKGYFFKLTPINAASAAGNVCSFHPEQKDGGLNVCPNDDWYVGGHRCHKLGNKPFQPLMLLNCNELWVRAKFGL